jgi:pilus assembly protein Flp/PilA
MNRRLKTNGVPLVCGSFLRDDSGQDLVEYGLILAVMALALCASMSGLATSLSNFFNKVGNSL